MAEPFITLTTDFGTASPYVAAMKGVILSLNPEARILDLSHDIPPQDVRHAAFFLASALPHFPPEALHVVVVDPGVGGGRDVLYAEVGAQRLLAPDNGCWTLLYEGRPPVRVIRLSERRFWRPTISNTFHGRDIFAPVAANLSLGLDPRKLGPAATNWVRLHRPAPTAGPEGILGEVLFVDHFGNLITNIPGEALARHAGVRWVQVGQHDVPRFVHSYAEADPGALVALVSSDGWLEVAVAQGSAARHLQAGVGTPVRAGWEAQQPKEEG
jgi:S-adenosyl-L-methionine hydrolase (adenosine-forming)